MSKIETSNKFLDIANESANTLKSLVQQTNKVNIKSITNFSSSTQFSDYCKKKAKEKNTTPQIIQQNYMIETLIEKISLSKYKDNFIIKGGFLIAYTIGVENRNTMDLDMTLKNLNLDADNLKAIFNEIFLIDTNSNIEFQILNISNAMEELEYPGLCIDVVALFDKMKIKLSIDVATGSFITPGEIQTELKKMFSDEVINIKAYTIETVLAEKYETFITRSITNTRMKDYYDLYAIVNLQLYDEIILNTAIHNTFKSRNRISTLNSQHINEVISAINKSTYINDLWTNYQKKYSYAKDITLDDIISSLNKITSYINFDINN